MTVAVKLALCLWLNDAIQLPSRHLASGLQFFLYGVFPLSILFDVSKITGNGTEIQPTDPGWVTPGSSES